MERSVTEQEVFAKILKNQFTVDNTYILDSSAFWTNDTSEKDYNVYEEPRKRKIKIFTRKKIVKI